MNITNTNTNNQTNQSFSSALSSFWFNLSFYTSTVMITPQREVDKIIPVFEKDVDSSYLCDVNGTAVIADRLLKRFLGKENI